MSEKETLPQMAEDESDEAAARRRVTRLRRWGAEALIGVLFVLAILGAGRFARGDDSALVIACTLGAMVTLASWFIFYVMTYRRLDELERASELQAIALAGGLAVFFAAVWGLGEAFLGAPDFPLAFIAPLFSALYAIIRLLISLRYR